MGSCPTGRQSSIKNIIKNPRVAVTAATIQASITFNHFGLTYLKIKFKNSHTGCLSKKIQNKTPQNVNIDNSFADVTFYTNIIIKNLILLTFSGTP